MEAISSALNPCNWITESFGCCDCSTEHKIAMVVIAIFAAIALFFVLESTLEYIAIAVAAGALLFALRWIFCSNSNHASGLREGISNLFSTIDTKVTEARDAATDGIVNFERATHEAEDVLGGQNRPHIPHTTQRPSTAIRPPHHAEARAHAGGGLRPPMPSSPSPSNDGFLGGISNALGDLFGSGNRPPIGGSNRPRFPGRDGGGLFGF